MQAILWKNNVLTGSYGCPCLLEINMKELKIGCAKPAAQRAGEIDEANNMDKGEKTMVLAKVGSKAPDFETSMYQNGNFGQVSLSDYTGKWVVLCFYPGDFTFV